MYTINDTFKYRSDKVNHTWHVLNIYRKLCLEINSNSRSKQATKSPYLGTAYLVLDKAEESLLDSSYGTDNEDCSDLPNLEFLKASAISGTEMKTYGFEESAQY